MNKRVELKLVRDFGELRAGMLVCALPCIWCGAQMERSMLIRLVDYGPPGDELGWTLEPACMPGRVVSAASVAQRRVFLVVDPEVTQVSYKRKRERVK